MKIFEKREEGKKGLSLICSEKKCLASRSQIHFHLSESCSRVGCFLWGETTVMSVKAKDNTWSKTVHKKKELTAPKQAQSSPWLVFTQYTSLSRKPI